VDSAYLDEAAAKDRLSQSVNGDTPGNLPEVTDMLNVACLADVEPQEVEFLWPGRIAIGKTHLFVGNPGLGKSFCTTDIAARITRGMEWPDGSGKAPIGKVLFLIGEDGLGDTVRPRLDNHGADVSKVFVIQSRRIQTGDGQETTDSQIRLDRDLPAIENLLKQHPETRILFIDPVSEYLGGTDSHKNAEMRALLAPLSRMADAHNIAIVNVSHFSKSVGGPAIYRAMGSLAFTAQARIAWAFVQDHEDENRILFLPLKNNLHRRIPGMAFQIVDDGRLRWETGEVTVSVDDAMNPPKERSRDKLNEAVAWLQQRLADGEVESNECCDDAKEAGIAFRTYRRAKEELNISSRKDRGTRKGKWFLSIPASHKTQGVPQQLYGLDGLDGHVVERGLDDHDVHVVHVSKVGNNGDPLIDEDPRLNDSF